MNKNNSRYWVYFIEFIFSKYRMYEKIAIGVDSPIDIFSL